MNAYQRRRHLARQTAMLPEDTRKTLERLRIFRNGAIGLVALPLFAGFMILSLSDTGLRSNEGYAMAASLIIGLALGKYVHDRSIRMAGEVLPELAAMEETDPDAIAAHAQRSWKDAFAPWMPYRPPAVFRWFGRLLQYGRGRRFGFIRSILPDDLIPSRRVPDDTENQRNS